MAQDPGKSPAKGSVTLELWCGLVSPSCDTVLQASGCLSHPDTFSRSSQRHGPPSRDPMCSTPAVLIPPSPLHTRMPATQVQLATSRLPPGSPLPVCPCNRLAAARGRPGLGLCSRECQLLPSNCRPARAWANQGAALPSSGLQLPLLQGVRTPALGWRRSLLPSVLPQPQVPCSFLQSLFTKV